MLTPKKIVHKKVFNTYGTRRHGTLKRGSTLESGEFGLKAITSSWVTSRQIEAARKVISKRCKGGKVFIRIFPGRPVTRKGLGMRMGSGVGGIEFFMFPVKPGRVLFEVSGIKEDIVREAFRVAASKMPVMTKIISKDDLFT
jgi:large subunit ribosomal protein L16